MPLLSRGKLFARPEPAYSQVGAMLAGLSLLQLPALICEDRGSRRCGLPREDGADCRGVADRSVRVGFDDQSVKLGASFVREDSATARRLE